MNELYYCQNFDPSNGYNIRDNIIYYTSDNYFENKIPRGISIWFSSDLKIKLFKIHDDLYGSLMWSSKNKNYY